MLSSRGGLATIRPCACGTCVSTPSLRFTSLTACWASSRTWTNKPSRLCGHRTTTAMRSGRRHSWP
eukprot:15439338-Alexandrium_andersonii.AAC.1